MQRRSPAAALLLISVSIGLAACSGGGRPRAAPTTPSSSMATTSPATTAPAPSTSAPASTVPPPAGLVDVDPSIVVRMRYARADNFTGAPLPGYEANRALLRSPAAAALAAVQRGLRAAGLTLVVLDAYRPVRATRAMVAWAHRTGHDALVGPYIAARSEHNLGVAVDVTLADAAYGRELDMGAPFDTFSPAASYPNASGPALANRRRLRQAMLAAGFQPYDQEWWHFSVPEPGAVALDAVIR